MQNILQNIKFTLNHKNNISECSSRKINFLNFMFLFNSINLLFFSTHFTEAMPHTVDLLIGGIPSAQLINSN